MSVNSWPFDQPPDCAVLATRQVLERTEPILHVTHDGDEHDWQFIGSSDGTLDNGRVVALREAVELDPSVLQLADLLLDGALFATQ